MIYKTFKEWADGQWLEDGEPRKQAYTRDELLLIEMGWNYGVDAARLARPEPAECDGGTCGLGGYCDKCPKTQPEPEPYGYISRRNWKMPVFIEADNVEAAGLPYNNADYEPVFKAPPQRNWQGLTDEELNEIYNQDGLIYKPLKFYRAIETKLKEKNA